MQEFVKKLIERLEEAKFDGNYTEAIWNRHGINKAIDIIHEEAKAYNEFATDTNVGSKGDLISRSELIKAIRKSTCH